METDGQLLERYATRQDNEAFAELVRRHVDLAYSAALRCANGNRCLAEEAVQTAFATMARKAETLSTHQALAAWLYQCARFTCIDLVRKEARRAQREREAVAMHEINGEDQRLAAELEPLVEEMLGTVKEADREILVLHFFSKCSHAELGRRLGYTEEAARKRVQRSLDTLRGKLLRRGITTSSAALALSLGSLPATAAPAALSATLLQAGAHAAAGAAASGGGFLALMGLTKLNTSTLCLLGIAGTATLGTVAGALGIQNSTTELGLLRQAAATAPSGEEAKDRLDAELQAQLAENKALEAAWARGAAEREATRKMANFLRVTAFEQQQQRDDPNMKALVKGALVQSQQKLYNRLFARLDFPAETRKALWDLEIKYQLSYQTDKLLGYRDYQRELETLIGKEQAERLQQTKSILQASPKNEDFAKVLQAQGLSVSDTELQAIENAILNNLDFRTSKEAWKHYTKEAKQSDALSAPEEQIMKETTAILGAERGALYASFYKEETAAIKRQRRSYSK